MFGVGVGGSDSIGEDQLGCGCGRLSRRGGCRDTELFCFSVEHISLTGQANCDRCNCNHTTCCLVSLVLVCFGRLLAGFGLGASGVRGVSLGMEVIH